MTDNPPSPSPVQATATVAGLITVVPTLLFSLPNPWGTVVAVSIVTCSAIVAAVPAPKDTGTKGSKVLVVGYNFVRICALALKYAIPYLVSRRGGLSAQALEKEQENVPPHP